jgi:LPS export ABC transporter protein LptC
MSQGRTARRRDGRATRRLGGGGTGYLRLLPCRRPAELVSMAAALLTGMFLPACKDDAIRPPVSISAADTADQVLGNMEHLITLDGVRRTKVLADTAYLYDATNLARLKVVTVTFYDANGGETSTVTSDSGMYQMRDGSMQAWSNVVAKTPDGRTLRSEELKYDARSKQISSDKPFTYDRADTHLAGNGFTSDPDFRNVVTRQPRGGQRPGGAAAGGGLLPGQ